MEASGFLLPEKTVTLSSPAVHPVLTSSRPEWPGPVRSRFDEACAIPSSGLRRAVVAVVLFRVLPCRHRALGLDRAVLADARAHAGQGQAGYRRADLVAGREEYPSLQEGRRALGALRCRAAHRRQQGAGQRDLRAQGAAADQGTRRRRQRQPSGGGDGHLPGRQAAARAVLPARPRQHERIRCCSVAARSNTSARSTCPEPLPANLPAARSPLSRRTSAAVQRPAPPRTARSAQPSTGCAGASRPREPARGTRRAAWVG